MKKRMTDAELEALIDADAESGGADHGDIMRELWRARRAEAKALAVLLKFRDCSHHGGFCNHHRAADALLKKCGLL